MATQQPEKKEIIPPSVRGVLSGTASGVAKLVVGHPFDSVKVRLQTEGYHGRFKGPIDCLVTTARTEGLRGLYKGATPPLFGWGIIDSLQVGVYAALKRQMQATHPEIPLSIAEVSLAGGIAGWASCSVVVPIELIKVKLQIQYDAATKLYTGPIDCAQKLYRANGISGLYQGFWGTFMFRTFISVYFGTYEYCKREFSKTQTPVLLQNFVSGGVAAIALWLCSFPFDVIKNRMQGQIPGPNRPYKTVAECVRKIYAHEGMKGFWRGFTPCLMRSVPTNGAAFVALELVTRYLP